MRRASASIRLSPGGQAAAEAGLPARKVADYLNDLDQIP